MLTRVSLFFTCLLPIFSETFQLNLEIEVTKSEPVYENLVRQTPYEYCWDEKVPVHRYRENDQSVGGGLLGGLLGRNIGKGKGKDAAIIAGTLIGSGTKNENEVLGGILGGVLGRQVGKGKGNDAAIAAGTLIGSNLSRKKTEDTGTYKIEKRCTTKYRDIQIRELVGYTNHGKIMGKDIQKFSTKELKTFPAKVSINY